MNSLTITKVTKWETSDGKVHNSQAMAEHHVMNNAVCDLFDTIYGSCDSIDSQDIVNVITSNKKFIREFLDKCDEMEKAILEG